MVQELPPLPRALGVASLALAGPPLVAPRFFLRTIGVVPGGTATAIARAVGVQELVAGVGILGLEAPRPRLSLAGRVAGDLAHAGLLTAAALRRPADVRRLAGALAFVAGSAAVDAYAAIRTARDGALGAPPKVREAVTIRKSRDDVRAAWNDFDFDAPPLKGSNADADFVAFDEAPGDRGTEVKVNLPGGASRPVKDDLRRFKQVVETGVIVRSDGTETGQRFFREVNQRPAQPVESGDKS